MTNTRQVGGAVALLESRCAAIDLHYARFPNSLDRTMEDTAKAIRTVASDLEQVSRERDEAVAELKRLRDAKWSDLSDAELGRCFKAFAEQVEAQSGKMWDGDAEMRLGLMNMGLQQAIKMAAESNAETFTYKATGFHSAGVQLGDWTVTIARANTMDDRDDE